MATGPSRWPRLTADVVRADVLAGLAVGLLLVPQSLAYAQLAGLSPIHGLYCALLPVVIGALAGWSHQLHTGPVAMTAILVAATLAPLATPGSSDYAALAALLALLVGTIRIGLGLLHAADMTRLISHPVLTGFTAAAAIIIASTQLPNLIGAPATTLGASPLNGFTSVAQDLTHPHWAVVCMGIGCLIALLICKRWPRLPGALLVLGFATFVSWLTGYSGATVGALPAGLPSISLPRMDLSPVMQLLPGAMLVALIGFAEVLSATRSCATKTRQSIDLNRELIGQGAASLAASVTSAFPPSGSLSRSALSLAAGTKTAISSVVSAVVVLIVLLGGTQLLAPMPLAALAALVVVAVLPLIDLRPLLRAWKTLPHDGIAGLAAFVLTLALAPDMFRGFLYGIALAVGLFLWRLTRPRVADCSKHPDGTWRDCRTMHLEPSPDLAVLRPDARISFPSATAVEDAINSVLTTRPQLRAIVLACESVNEIDATGCEALRGIARTLADANVTCVLSGLKGPVQDVAQRSGLLDLFGSNNVFRTTDDAVKALESRLGLGPQPWDPPTMP